jgi:aminopeptidase 2
LNADHSALFRTSYTPERLTKLGESAKAGLMTVEDRAGMIADAGALASSGYGKTSGMLSLLKSFDSESSYVVWNEILSRLNAVRSAWIFEDEETKAALKTFQLVLCADKAHELGWTFSDNEDHVMSQFKSLLFGSAGLAGDEKIIKASQEMFEKWAAGDYQAIHPNLRAGVLSMALRDGGVKEYDSVLKRYHEAPTADERNTCLRSLGRAKTPELIKRTLDMALSGEIKMQDVYMPIGGLRSHAEGINARFAWMKENWETLVKALPPTMTMLSSVVTICVGGFTRETQMQEVEKFFSDKEKTGFDMALNQAIDGIKAKESWLQRDSKDVAQWLSSNGYLKAGQGKL